MPEHLRCQKKFLSQQGMTLVELMVTVAIVGLLASVAIPAFTGYVKDARLSEAKANILAILEAQEAYYVRFQHYTTFLPVCPPALPPAGETQLWPDDNNIIGQCGRDWWDLGWRPDGPLYFQYSAWTHYIPAFPVAFGGPDQLRPNFILPDRDTWGVDWQAEGFGPPGWVIPPPQVQPWCVIQAEADTDGDGQRVYLRTNSYNHKYYRTPNPDDDGVVTW